MPASSSTSRNTGLLAESLESKSKSESESESGARMLVLSQVSTLATSYLPYVGTSY